MQLQINSTNLDTLAKRIAATGTELGFTKNGKPMVASQGLRILASVAGFREEHSFVVAVKAETPVPDSTPDRNALGALFSYLTNNYNDDTWDASTRGLLEEAARVLGEPELSWILHDDEEGDDATEDELLVKLATNGSHSLDLEDIKFWVGQHYHRIYENETPAKRREWIRRYAASFGLTPDVTPITEAQKQELRDKGYRIAYSDSDHNLPYWETDLEASVDFPSEDAAWEDAWLQMQFLAKSAPAAEKQELPTQVDDDGFCNACAAKGDTMADAMAKLEARWGHEHAWYGRSEWCEDVAQGNTKLGYWEWVQHSLEANGGDVAHCSVCGQPSPDEEAWPNGHCVLCLREANQAAAEQAFESYDFGATVGETSGWESLNNTLFSRPVYLENSEAPDAPTTKVTFTVEVVAGKVKRVSAD